MANPEHLKILGQGVEAWNRWREATLVERPDLRGVILDDRDLSCINLVGADLTQATLRRADLGTAHLNNAQLDYVSLNNADMTAAFCNGASIRDSSLAHARLEYTTLDACVLDESDLRGAVFRRVSLNSVSMRGVTLNGTVFFDCNLSSVTGLDRCVHQGPSGLDYATLLKSKNLPKSFLEGCGVPEPLLSYLPSLRTDALQLESVFISYTSANDAFARRLHADLRAAGVRVWFAPEDMKGGARIREAIDEGIRLMDRHVVVLSEASLKSRWVEKEFETIAEHEAKSGKLMLYPIRIDDAVMQSETGWGADVRRARNIIDFSGAGDAAYQKAFQRLLGDLRKL